MLHHYIHNILYATPLLEAIQRYLLSSFCALLGRGSNAGDAYVVYVLSLALAVIATAMQVMLAPAMPALVMPAPAILALMEKVH